MIKLPKKHTPKEDENAEIHALAFGWNECIDEFQRLNSTAQPVSKGWIKCSDRMPQNEPGLWSTPVAAVSNLGDVFQLSCMCGYWQRTKDFVESGASEIVYWMYLPISLDKNLTE